MANASTAAGSNTLTSFNTEFKYIQDERQNLLPENAVLMKLVPKLAEAQTEGRKYLVPVQLTHENGVTFGDGTAFALNAASAAVYSEIAVDAFPMVLLTVISNSVANRMANTKKAFITESSLRAEVMYNSLSRFAEIAMLYGQGQSPVTGSGNSLGTTSTTTVGVANTSTSETVTLTAAQWSAGIWASAVGAVVNFYKVSDGTLVSSSTDANFTITSVNVANKSITVSGTSTGCTALHTADAAALNVFWLGAHGTEMLGLDAQIVGGATFFGIDPTVYPLWQGQSFDCLSASLSMGKVLAGAGKCVAVGGLNSEAALMLSAATYADLNSDQAALRQYDGSYNPKENENGSEDLCYRGPNGKIRVMINNITKEGEAHLVPVKHLKRVGAKEISFERPGQKDQFFQEIPNVAGYSLRAELEFVIVLERPAQACKFINIVNTAH